MEEAIVDISERLKNYILSNFINAKVASGGKEICCRCFECGDSKKHITSAHMYITLPTDKSPAMYYCHLCNAGGILTYDKMREWGFGTLAVKAIFKNLDLHQSKYIPNYTMVGTTKYYHVNNSFITPGPDLDEKVSYLNSRLGLNLSMFDYIKLKTVFNLKDVLYGNNIDKTSRSSPIVNGLSKHYVGFLSYDNAFVTMRQCLNTLDLDKNIYKRYVVYKIFNKADPVARFYIIPQMVNLLNRGKIQLHVSEGIFDILSIYFNIRKQENGLYAAACGSNLMNAVKYFAEDLGIPNLEVHLYPDNDKLDIDYKDVVNEIQFRYMSPIYIHRNAMDDEKDFGVPVDRIRELVYQVA